MSTRTIDLDSHKNLFRDAASFEAFVRLFRPTQEEDSVAVFSHQELLGAILSTGAMKEFLFERMLRRLKARPELLTELAERLEEDDVVE